MRAIGMAAGPIPLDRVVWYLDRFVQPAPGDETERWIRLIRRMDNAYQKALSPAKPEK